MTRQQETGMVVIVGAIILAFLFLTSCSTKKTITEFVAVHDTLIVTHTDTLRVLKVTRDTIVDWKVLATHDTIHHEIERVLTLNERGDTISKKEWDRLWQKIHEMESARHDESHTEDMAYYKSTIDSLQKVIDQEREKNTVKTKARTPIWELAIFLCIIIFVLWGVSKVK